MWRQVLDDEGVYHNPELEDLAITWLAKDVERITCPILPIFNFGSFPPVLIPFLIQLSTPIPQKHFRILPSTILPIGGHPVVSAEQFCAFAPAVGGEGASGMGIMGNIFSG